MNLIPSVNVKTGKSNNQALDQRNPDRPWEKRDVSKEEPIKDVSPRNPNKPWEKRDVSKREPMKDISPHDDGGNKKLDYQSPHIGLISLYKQRDAVAKGLHDLGYEICLSARIGRIKKMIGNLGGNFKKPKPYGHSKCPVGVVNCAIDQRTKMFGERIVLPMAKHLDEKGKSQKLRSMLPGHQMNKPFVKKGQKEVEVKNPDYHEDFFQGFFGRTSCLRGDAIMNGCIALSPEIDTLNEDLKALQKLIKGNEKFKKRFNKDLACKIAYSKKLYIKKLLQIENEIDRFLDNQ